MRLSVVALPIAVLLSAVLTPASASPYTFTTFVAQGDPQGINNVGQVVEFDNAQGQGAVLDLSSGITTGFSFPGAANTYALGINDYGQVVGTAPDSVSSNAFLRNPATGAFTSIGRADAPRLSPDGINNAGQIVGYANGVGGFLRDPITGQFTPVLGPGGNSLAYNPRAINNLGQIVGYAASDGFLLDTRTSVYTTLRYPGSVSTIAYGINDFGQIVGNYYLNAGRSPISYSFVYDETTGSYSDLSGPGFSDITAAGINDAGQILGDYYSYETGSGGSYIATPQAVAVPEPTTLALLGASVVGLSMVERWRSSRKTTTKACRLKKNRTGCEVL